MKKRFALTGIICGVLCTLLGVCFMFGVFGGDTFFVVHPSPEYDTGYAIFGSDAYTYIANNAALAAVGAEATANNTRELVDLVRDGEGCLFIVIGIFMVCFFGMKYSDLKKPLAEQTVNPSGPDIVQSGASSVTDDELPDL